MVTAVYLSLEDLQDSELFHLGVTFLEDVGSEKELLTGGGVDEVGPSEILGHFGHWNVEVDLIVHLGQNSAEHLDAMSEQGGQL